MEKIIEKIKPKNAKCAPLRIRQARYVAQGGYARENNSKAKCNTADAVHLKFFPAAVQVFDGAK
ncbi:MAG TPA: hypothetical protein VLJ17_04870 [Xanthobacteraceae bacterium]|nr:hypothetical protein [Xanthobacteraceae bacterium]